MGLAATPLDDTGIAPKRLGCALWFTGLPGSGKSAVAAAVAAALTARGLPVTHLAMDARRRHYVHKPAYTEAERNEAYRMFVDEAAALAGEGRIVLLDGTGHKLAMRAYAREKIPRFAEIHLRCTLATAMRREAGRTEGLVMAGLYAKAIRRKTTGETFPGLGEVIGVDTPFEQDPGAELTIDAETTGVEAARDLVLARFAAWLGA